MNHDHMYAARALLLVIHSCTVLFSVRAHNVLGRGFDAATHRMLVDTNWIRTLGWTTRIVDMPVDGRCSRSAT